MNIPVIFDSEYRLCLLVWEHAPIRSTALVKLCQSRLHWSKSTTYTVIRRLSEKGILENKDAIVHSLIPKEKVQDALLESFVENTLKVLLPISVRLSPGLKIAAYKSQTLSRRA